MTLTPRPYQIEGRDFLASRRHALLADEMRVGKTPQAILAAHKLGARSVLVVCPAIAVRHWEREFERWWPDGPLPRRVIWSYDKARQQWQEGVRGRPDVFIPDECHFAKNPEAERTKMVYGKTGFAASAGATWPLSGTPATKHAAELWPMMRAFGVVGCTYEEFVRLYCTVNPLTLRITGTKVEKIPELRAMLATFMLRRTRKQVRPDMPDIGYEFLEITPDSKVDMPAVGTLSDDALLDWLEEHPSANAEDRQAVAMAKVPALVDEIIFAIENGLLKQTVVFGWHVAPLQELCARLFLAGVNARWLTGATTPAERERIQDEFRRGTTQVICANIIAAGTAIDLSAASHGYFLELWWIPGANVQAANRLVSLDKDEAVTFDVATWPGSTDDRIQRVLLQRVKQLAIMF